MASAKLEIGLFDGSNWATWKFKIRLLLQSYPGTLDAVEGKLQKPTLPGEQTEANLNANIVVLMVILLSNVKSG